MDPLAVELWFSYIDDDGLTRTPPWVKSWVRASNASSMAILVENELSYLPARTLSSAIYLLFYPLSLWINGRLIFRLLRLRRDLMTSGAPEPQYAAAGVGVDRETRLRDVDNKA